MTPEDSSNSEAHGAGKEAKGGGQVSVEVQVLFQDEKGTQTLRKELVSVGMEHIEGGWPHEINPLDDEQTERFRKRVQRDPAYVESMLRTTARMEKAVLHNNAVNIFAQYFENTDGQKLKADLHMKTRYVYRMDNTGSDKINCISLSPTKEGEIVVGKNGHQSYILNPESPQIILESEEPITCIEYHPKEPLIGGGLQNGKVAIWDMQKGGQPLAISREETSHRDAVTDFRWRVSMTGREFFTTSKDGIVKWWDRSVLMKPTDEIIMGPPLTCICYDGHDPYKFLLGTENGQVLAVNRRGTKPEEKQPWKCSVSQRAVRTLERNPAFPKIYITVDGWNVKVWHEDKRDAPLFMTGKSIANVKTARWSPTRFSLIVTGCEDGYIDIWDILLKLNQPIFSFRFQSCAVTHLEYTPTDQRGQELAALTSNDQIHVIRMSPAMVHFSFAEKAKLGGIFELQLSKEKFVYKKVAEMNKKEPKNTEERPKSSSESKVREEEWPAQWRTDFLRKFQEGL